MPAFSADLQPSPYTVECRQRWTQYIAGYDVRLPQSSIDLDRIGPKRLKIPATIDVHLIFERVVSRSGSRPRRYQLGLPPFPPTDPPNNRPIGPFQ